MGPVRLTALLPLACLIALAGGCGGSVATSAGSRPGSRRLATHSSPAASTTSTRAGRSTSSRAPASPRISVLGDPARAGPSWRPAVSVDGSTAAWVAQRPGVSLMRFDQSLLRLKLHAGIGEPAGSGWAGGSAIERPEAPNAVAGFNGGFRLDLSEVGFLLRGRVGAPLKAGLASIVTYAEGDTGIGSWRSQEPARGRRIVSVLQNLRLLIDEGAPAPTLSSCVQECWGSTLGGGADVARSGLGVRGDGQLVWAGGESLSPAALAQALLRAGAKRAVQLDINPEWVAAYLYVHRRGGISALQVIPSQPGIPGQLLSPYNRDFFAVLAR